MSTRTGRVGPSSQAPTRETAGNILYGVHATSPTDVWAVGQQLGTVAPDQTLIEHWDGSNWTVVPSPVFGAASAFLDGVTSTNGDVWAVGESDDPREGAHPLVERYHNGRWTTVGLPAAGSNWTELWGVTAASGNVWAVGTYVDNAIGNNKTLMVDGDPNGWSVDAGPHPGSGSNLLGGIAATDDRNWAASTTMAAARCR